MVTGNKKRRKEERKKRAKNERRRGVKKNNARNLGTTPPGLVLSEAKGDIFAAI